MKSILPMGYAKGHLGLVAAVLFGGFGGFLCYMAWKGDAELLVVLPFALVLVVLVLGLVLSDVTKNMKAGKNMAHREDMLKFTHAKGEIVEQKLIFCVGGREFPNAPAQSLHLRANNQGFRFRVSFEDPRTGQRRETTSELYSFFALYEYEREGGRIEKKAKFKEKEANVYVDLEGNAWVELIPVS